MDEFLKLANHQFALNNRAPCTIIGGFNSDSRGIVEYNNIHIMEEDSTNRYTNNYENYIIGGAYISEDTSNDDVSENTSNDDVSDDDTSYKSQEDTNLASNWI
jgi:hypothetical protein